MKAVHKEFFPVFALLESPLHAVGVRVVAQRKLLYLEKLVAALLLAAPNLREQLDNRITVLKGQVSTWVFDVDGERRRRLLALLEGLSSLLNFYLPCLFQLGYLVRCCTWEGRSKGSGAIAKKICEDVLVLLVHLLKDNQAKNEYVRTLAISILTWQPMMSQMPGVCFAEESCEAMLSRLSHRCEVYRHLHGLDATFNLFLTMPLPSKIPKGTRGGLRIGLVKLFASRIRKVVFSDGCLPFAPNVGARTMHSFFEVAFPEGFKFPTNLPNESSASELERVLRYALRTLLGKVVVSENVSDFLVEKVPRRTDTDLREYQQATEKLNAWFRDNKEQTKPKPPAKKQFMAKPKAPRSTFNTITQKTGNLICLKSVDFKKIFFLKKIPSSKFIF